MDSLTIHLFCCRKGRRKGRRAEGLGCRTRVTAVRNRGNGAPAGQGRLQSRRYTTISELLINGKIGDREIRLIGSQGQQIGVMNSKEALRMAREEELDLVMIAPTANPPVCKIIDYGKYRYEMARKEKDARKKQKTVETKEVRLTPNIEENDLNTKVKAARKFLEKGDKVKVTLRFRGREMSHMNQSRHILDDFAQKVEDIANVDKAPKVEGRSLVMFLSEKR